MNKIILATSVALAVVIGSYFFMEQRAQSAAEKAIAYIERDIEASIPNSDFTFGMVAADFFSNSAIVSDLAIKVGEEKIATAKSLAISGIAKTIKRAEIIGLEYVLKKNQGGAELSIQKAVLLDTDVAAVNAVIGGVKSKSPAAAKALNNFSIGEVSLSGVSFAVINAVAKITLAEFSLADVVFEGGMLVKGKTSISGLKIPLDLINQIDRSAAHVISNFTDDEDFVLSLSTSVDFDTVNGTFDTEMNFGAEGFAKMKFIAGLAGLDAKQVVKASEVSEIFEAMQIWALIAEDLRISGITLEYLDEQLANTLLAENGNNELAAMSEMQINMLFGQYPKMADQLKIALGAFLEGKNSFKASAKAKSPVKINEIQQLFASGELTNAMSFEFSGS